MCCTAADPGVSRRQLISGGASRSDRNGGDKPALKQELRPAEGRIQGGFSARRALGSCTAMRADLSGRVRDPILGDQPQASCLFPRERAMSLACRHGESSPRHQQSRATRTGCTRKTFLGDDSDKVEAVNSVSVVQWGSGIVGSPIIRWRDACVQLSRFFTMEAPACS